MFNCDVAVRFRARFFLLFSASSFLLGRDLRPEECFRDPSCVFVFWLENLPLAFLPIIMGFFVENGCISNKFPFRIHEVGSYALNRDYGRKGRHPNTWWGSVFEPSTHLLRGLLGLPNASLPGFGWFGCLGEATWMNHQHHRFARVCELYQQLNQHNIKHIQPKTYKYHIDSCWWWSLTNNKGIMWQKYKFSI